MIGKFSAPDNLKNLSIELKNKEDNTFILAGGTDLTIKFRKDNIFDFNIIDIGKIEELRKIEEDEDLISIGACVTMTQIENSHILQETMPALVLAASNVGSTQIRNKATIGGNIANAAQCGDTIPVLFAHNAKLKILNSSNEYRYENIEDFIQGINKTTLKSDEIIVSIKIKKTNSLSSFSKVGSRKTVTISKINCCGKFSINDNIIENADIYMGAIGVKPVKAELIEKAIIGKDVENIVEQIKVDIENQIENTIPDRSSKHYKKIAAIGVIEDMLNNLRR